MRHGSTKVDEGRPSVTSESLKQLAHPKAELAMLRADIEEKILDRFWRGRLSVQPTANGKQALLRAPSLSLPYSNASLLRYIHYCAECGELVVSSSTVLQLQLQQPTANRCPSACNYHSLYSKYGQVLKIGIYSIVVLQEEVRTHQPQLQNTGKLHLLLVVGHISVLRADKRRNQGKGRRKCV